MLREPQDIGSYSALACIAIQSNQNDQHGGQAIASFDYGMAPGRGQKTYFKRFRRALGAAPGSAGNHDAADDEAKRYHPPDSRAETGATPDASSRTRNLTTTARALTAMTDEATVERMLHYSDFERGYRETERQAPIRPWRRLSTT